MGPFEELERIGLVAYRLALPPTLAAVHNVFHVSMLRKNTPDPTHIIDHETLPIRKDLSYEEKPIGIMARDVRRLRRREIPLVKILWKNHRDNEATWDCEDDMRRSYPELFRQGSTFEDKSS